MKPITELASIEPRIVANLGQDSEGMGHVAHLLTADPTVFLTVMGIIKATNLNDQGKHSPAGDIGVAFSVGFLTAWHIYQQQAMDKIAASFLSQPEPVVMAEGTRLVMKCGTCDGGGILSTGTACSHCNGFGNHPIPNLPPVAPRKPSENLEAEPTPPDTVCELCNGQGFLHDDIDDKCPKCFRDCV